MNRLQWYPKGKREEIEEFLSKLLELEREDKLTIWSDEDEAGKRFYDIRERHSMFETDQPLFERTVVFIKGLEKVSAVDLQRQFRCTYMTAQRIIDELVERILIEETFDQYGRHVVFKKQEGEP